MAYVHVASTVIIGTAAGATTAAIDTTGANLIVILVTPYYLATLALTDSKGNTWTPLTAEDVSATGGRAQLYYCENPTVGASHTFTSDQSGLCVLAVSGGKPSSFDVENGANNSNVTTLATGSVTPSEDSELLVTGVNFALTTATVSIDLGFTIIGSYQFSSGQSYGGAFAYLIQTTAAARNPTWTFTASELGIATRIAVFKAAAAGGSVRTPRRMLSGVGA